MNETDKFFDKAGKTLDDLRGLLSAGAAQMQVFATRLETAQAQIKKSIPLRDDGLEAEFNKTAKELFDFSNNADEQWLKMRDTLRKFNKKDLAENYGLEIKSFNIRARSAARAIDEVATAFGYLYPRLKESTLRLNVWLLENATLNFDKLASKILFTARELSKLTETYGKRR